MSIFDSINRTIKNVFVGSHKGEDIHLEAFEDKPVSKNTKIVYTPQPPPGFVAEEKVSGGGENDLGVNPSEWFDSPNKYAPAERTVELNAEPPRPEEEIADWFSIEKPDESDVIEEEKTMHQKMYEMATARYNPFSLGGSENCDSDISCEVQKHSPWPGGSENFQGGSERIQK